jgi:gliding motility-associated-like protein
MKKLLLSLMLLSSAPGFAQTAAPGGVTANLRLWLKANSGVHTGAANDVTLWGEQSGANVTGDFTTQGAAIGMTGQNPPAYGSLGVNFNPHLVFSQTAVNSISSNNAFVGTQLIDPYANTAFEVIRLHTMTSTGVWFKWQYNNTNTARFGNEVNNGGTNTGRLRFDFRGVNNYSSGDITERYVLAGLGTTQAQNTIRLNGALDATVNYGSQAAFAAPVANPARITFGNEEYGDAYPTSIDIAEIIMFNRELTAAERNKVESYLAVKYGVTLDQSALFANNYVSAGNTIIWNRAKNIPFLQNITGIGRDDADSLLQKQSKSINTAGLVTIFNGSFNGSNFPALNTDNANGFAANNTFLLFGDNGAAMALERCFSGNPSFLRMSRSWKVQITGNVGTVTLAAKKADLPPTTAFLLVSTDSAFTPGRTTAYRLDTANGYMSKAVQLADSNYFTFASDSLLLRLTTNSPLCVGATIRLSTDGPATGTYSWTGPNGFTSTSARPEIAAAGQANSGVYTVNATYNGCAFAPTSAAVFVSQMPAPPRVVTPILYCVDDTAQPLQASGTELRWYGVPSGGAAGVYIPPVPNTDREDSLTFWVTQSTNGCESIRTKQDVIIRNRPRGIIVASRPTICQGDADTFIYVGSNMNNLTYDWKTPVFRSVITSGDGPGPVVVQFDSSGVINVRLQVNNRGCIGKEILFPVTVNPRPGANAVVKHDACVNEPIEVGLNRRSPDATGFFWDFDQADIRFGGTGAGPHGIQWSTPGDKIVALTTTAIGCKSFTTYDTITVHTPPTARIVSMRAPNSCLGDSVSFEAFRENATDSYKWFPERYFKGDFYRTWGVVEKSGFIRVDVTSEYGCTATDSALLKLQSCCQVFFPNAFTPNGDGRNDVFGIITQGHHQINNFRVMNRWGQVVFETKDENRGWDGSFNGRAQDMGTYFYYLNYRCNEGDAKMMEQQGEVILVR